MRDEEKTCNRCKGSGEVMAMTQEHGPDDYEFAATCPDCNGTGVTTPPTLTLFLCGPNKCEHDYSGYAPMEGGGEPPCAQNAERGRLTRRHGYEAAEDSGHGCGQGFGAQTEAEIEARAQTSTSREEDRAGC